jgi:hypothetical protein
MSRFFSQNKVSNKKMKNIIQVIVLSNKKLIFEAKKPDILPKMNLIHD